MIDIHTHILPGVDDGAKDAQEAAALITMLKEQGVTHAVLTPHYYSYSENLSDFLERRRLSYQSIKDCGFNLILASETYLSESLLSYDAIDDLTIGNTRYLLLELPDMEEWGSGLFRQISRTIAKYNVRPIIAHVDRYEPVLRRKEKALLQLTDLGCLLQINIDSVIEKKTRASALRLIKRGWVDFVGSDCHDVLERPPRFDLFSKIMRKKCGMDPENEWNEVDLCRKND
jgi:protein-tyrosine phosphatase